MLAKFVIVFFSVVNILAENENERVKYYLDLIQNEMSKALTSSLPKNANSYMPESEEIKNGGTYDFIIVGGGSAGAVIANRLSEDPKVRVLLLEAGGEETNYTDIPKSTLSLQGLKFNWNYESIPQTTCCLGMVHHICPVARGKGLGGTSIINGMTYVRGNKKDFDNWEKLDNLGWNYDEVLRLFKKSENFIPPDNDNYHGKNGRLDVNYVNSTGRFLQAFLQGNVEAGRPIVDSNGKNQLGVSQVQLTIKNGRRESTFKAFLRDIKTRSNLSILKNSFVTKILTRFKKAYGVMFNNNKDRYIAKASKEVIISAGSIASPQLLMLSGIGPIEDLKRVGIKAIEDLNVGMNLQNHAAFWALGFTTNHTELDIPLSQSVEEYLKGYGSLTKPLNVEGVAFLNTNSSDFSGQPDVEFMMAPLQETPQLMQKVFNFKLETLMSLLQGYKIGKSFNVVTILLHPKSKGFIKLKSNSPYDYPIINNNYFSDTGNEDIEKMYKGIKLALELTNTNAFKEINAVPLIPFLPSCSEFPYSSRDYWYCLIRHFTMDVFHPTGTCKMGKSTGDGAVVNNELKVFGIKNLRVADASIIPTITSGHMNAIAIMIGEKVSELIKKEYKLK